MKRPPRLSVQPSPSRIACAFVAVCCVATAVLVVLLPMPWWAKAAGLLVVVGVGARAYRQCAARGLPALVQVGDDRRLTVTWRTGTSSDGVVLDDTYVGAWLTCVVWRPDGMPWWQPARTLLLLPDTLPTDEFRRLRVLLRYGVPERRGASKGVDAG